MRFNVAAAAAGAAFLVGGVNAEDQKVLKDESSSSSVAESATKSTPELPTFTVSIAPHRGCQPLRIHLVPPPETQCLPFFFSIGT
jgi:hypothetical protein